MALEPALRQAGFHHYEMKSESAKMQEIIFMWTRGLGEDKIIFLEVLILLPLPSESLHSTVVWWLRGVTRNRYNSVL